MSRRGNTKLARFGSRAAWLAGLLFLAWFPACAERPSGCGDGSAPCEEPGSARRNGSVGISLEISQGIFVDEVEFTISGNDIAVIEGTIPVEDPGSTVSVKVGGLPSGEDYVVTLRAEAPDTECIGSAEFDIVAGQTTFVHVTLNCRVERDDGTLILDGGFNTCPVITSVIAVPLSVAIGNSVHLSSSVQDANGDAMSVEWTAEDGEFDDPEALATDYVCPSEGTHTLLLSVSDGRCADAAEVEVECVNLCGNADLDAGEECDDGAHEPGDGCDALCRVEVCGNARVDFGEECDDGALEPGDGCDALCRVEVCGNARVDFGEECDDGNPDSGDGCSPACLAEICGNARVDFGEECDDGNPDSGDGCSPACLAEICGNGRVDFGEACDDGNLTNRDGCDEFCQQENLCELCLEDNCAALMLACDTPACTDVLSCVEASNCAAGGAVTDCYCGVGVSLLTCLNTAVPGGVCRPPIQVGTSAIFPAVVIARLIDPAYPAGDAMQRVLCEQNHCSSVCSD